MPEGGHPDNPDRPTLRYLFLRFLRYGFLAWGGPVAQIGLMHRELVERDRWISEERFRKVLALYQALPGPEAMELAVYFGMLKRGRLGGFLAGLAFLLPGVVLLTALAALYVAFAATASWGEALLYGLRPAVIALVVLALLRLTRSSVTSLPLALVAVGAAAAAFLLPDLNFLLLLLAGGLVIAILATTPGKRQVSHASLVPLAAFTLTTGVLVGVPAFAALFWVALKAGLFSFGGAYTAIPFLHEGAVVEHGWLTNEAFLEAFALTGLVPGPLIAFATFIGYTAGGLAGAALATVGVFAPAFLITLLAHHHLERLVDEPHLHAFLLGVTAAVMGLIAVSLLPLAQGALVDAWTVAITLGAAALLHFPKWRIPYVIAACAVAGLALRHLPQLIG